MKRYFYSLVVVLVFLIFSGCKKDETPTAPQNHLPKIGSLTANPTTVLINTETTITCIATDEDGDNLTITWASKRGTFSNGVVGVAVKWVSPSTAGKDTITATVNDGKQTIQGKLEIIVGTISASPTLLTPNNNATEVPLSPTLTWNAVTNAVSYTLQVSTSNSFPGFVYNQNGLTNTSQQISGLNSNTTYYWRVNSTNIYGTSSWSNIFSFKTVAPPQAPTLLAPTNNATEVALSPTLTWNAVSNAVSYTLQISANNSFSSFVHDQSGLTNTSQQIIGLNEATIYFWRVAATNIYGTSSYSTTWSFLTAGTSSLLLTSPNGGETWYVGETQQITWQANHVSNIKIEYSSNNGFNWVSIINSTPASTGSYNCVVPNVLSSLCKIKITNIGNPAVTDVSDERFTITKGTSSLLLTSPNGGETWYVGETQQITWQANHVSNIKIEHSSNNGLTWNSIINSTPASTGSYNYIVPNSLSTQNLIKITDIENPAVTDVSDAIFRITK